jgi:hypothetical protein
MQPGRPIALTHFLLRALASCVWTYQWLVYSPGRIALRRRYVYMAVGAYVRTAPDQIHVQATVTYYLDHAT